jgi:GTP-binding protein
VDAPGYGSTIYANISTINFAKMIEDYVKERSLRGIVLLLDLRHELGDDDVAFLNYLKNCGKPLLYVITKCDQMNQSALSAAKRLAGKYGVLDPIYSFGDLKSLEPLKGRIEKCL